ncbi:MAG: hypothetical protein O3C15_10070 [Proteobacteria bacterium]|nr:hypothetical protein [Pseudomonadota bacterium]
MKQPANSLPADAKTYLRPLYYWFRHHQERGSKIFETYASLKWFVKHQQRELVDAGVLIPETKDRPALVTSQFGNKLYEMMYGGG